MVSSHNAGAGSSAYSPAGGARDQEVHIVLPRALHKLPVALQYLLTRILAAATRLETSTSIPLTISRLRAWKATRGERIKYSFLTGLALGSLYIMKVPSMPLKLFLPASYILALLLPISSQFILPATPILAWLLFYYSSQFLDPASRPHIWVSVLPTLETIWYGASISDILTRFGHPALDILAWLPYGVIHFVAPFVVAALLFVFAPPTATKVFGNAFGFLNLLGVLVQVGFPCAPPWYELREGLTPANYGMKGSPAGLARIDELFGGHGYTLTFTNAPVPFGAFPSLHAGCATMEALFLSYFFPVQLELPIPGTGIRSARKVLRLDARIVYWSYAAWLYWCTMYLMHHYLVDLVGGGCLATACFYFFLTPEMRFAMEANFSGARPSAAVSTSTALPAATIPDDGFGMRPSIEVARARPSFDKWRESEEQNLAGQNSRGGHARKAENGITDAVELSNLHSERERKQGGSFNAKGKENVLFEAAHEENRSVGASRRRNDDNDDDDWGHELDDDEPSQAPSGR
ncbi:related to aur1-inositol phosphorylceramide synthase [Ceraceosorus bombacis]|uniref:Related to aur1-inositol phosphorylceramide synthase n=1 Tax=Ceraceosorus bombacis TaxID=401625 RepID=A0A0P1BAE6_9BASI|nr:related to aur1-inositol phosphorylceramide synthase [Ceraceosorus bombacis]